MRFSKSQIIDSKTKNCVTKKKGAREHLRVGVKKMEKGDYQFLPVIKNGKKANKKLSRELFVIFGKKSPLIVITAHNCTNTVFIHVGGGCTDLITESYFPSISC